MRQSVFSKFKGLVILLLIILLIIVIIIIYSLNPLEHEPEYSDISNVATSTLISPLQISPLSFLSPVSEIENYTNVVTLPGGQTLFSKGIEFFKQGDYEAAIDTFDKVITTNPLDVIAFDARGTTYTALGDYNKAIDDYSAAIKIDPGFARSYYNRGRVHSFLKSYNKALIDLQKSIELSPEFGYRANGNIGLIYHKMGEYDNALEAFEESMSYDDSKADLFYLRGETYTALEDYNAAIADYQAALQRFSRYDLAYQSLGYAYYKNGMLDQAQENFNQALEISPASPIAHFYLALVNVAQDNLDQAKAEISQATQVLPTLPEEEQELILTRMLTELKILAEKKPGQNIESLLELLPQP